LFLKLGVIGFGGPAAHIAMMEDEVVRRRQWLNREEFLDLLGATNLIPGPNSTEMAIHIGRIRAGLPGLLVAGVCFIIPAMLLVMGCAWLYVTYGSLPQTAAFTYGVKPVIITIVTQALWSLAKSAVKTPALAVIGLAAVVATAAGSNELLVLAAGALLASMTPRLARGVSLSVGPPPTALFAPANSTASSVPLMIASSTAGAAPFAVWPLFWFFVKVGSILFGSGYVLLAFLRADLVERWHWLTESQLLDAIAVGQITPGPVFTTATFIGFILGGVPASVAATIGIFLPAFVFVAVSAPYIPRIRRSPWAGRLLDGVNVASLALMAVVTWQLASAALRDIPTVVMALTAAILLIRFRVNSAWLVLGGAVAGYTLHHP
jgi:chromate transporter